MPLPHADDSQILAIAKVCHQINKAYCESLGDMSQGDWEYANEQQKQSIIAGVKYTLENPDITPQMSHESWLAFKEKDGWTYGPVKDFDKKEHPCFVPYDELPADQKAKDFLFKAAVKSAFGLLMSNNA